jgi:DNA-binding transcriptional MerR regulator
MAHTSAMALPSKLYFRIGEVAELVGVEPHVLRYWEREFRSIRPTKSAKGQRVYSRRDVENLLRVRELLYQEGFTIAGAKKRLLQPLDAEVQGRDSDPPPVSATRSEPAPQSGDTSFPAHDREELLAMRSEIETFLAELDLESG